MIKVAEALSVIHNPQGNILRSAGGKGVGFHFDLKPANILITDKGELKITDFGLSMIKRVAAGSSSYGIFRGGAPKYQPPEVSPLFNQADNVQYSALANCEPEITKNSYDIWSFACILVETLIYLLETERNCNLKAFMNKLEREGDQIPNTSRRCQKIVPSLGSLYFRLTFRNTLGSGQTFHQHKRLKDAVEEAIKRLYADDAMSAKTYGFESWAHGVAALLKSMLNIDPRNRPSSPQVFVNLRELQKEYEKGQDDEVTAALKKITRDEYSNDLYNEVMYRAQHHSRSFLDMLVILMPSVMSILIRIVRDNVTTKRLKNTDDEFHNCRIRIMQGKEDQELAIIRCYKNIRIEHGSQRCKTD